MHVALVTAAGYAYDAPRYMRRLAGLFAYFELHQLAADAAARFWVLGGECNYLFRCGAGARLTEIAADAWLPESVRWAAADVAHVLDVAERSIRGSMVALKIRGRVLRKELASACVR